MNESTLRVRGIWNYSISKDFVCDTSLSRHARFLFVVLRSFASPTSPSPFPKVTTLCHLLDVNRDTLAKYMQELVDKGHVEKEQRLMGGNVFGSNQYYLDEFPSKNSKKPNDFPLQGFSVTENSVPGDSVPEKPATKSKPVVKSPPKEKEEPPSSIPRGEDGEVFSASQRGKGTGGEAPSTPGALEFCQWWGEKGKAVFGMPEPNCTSERNQKAVEALLTNGASVRLLQAVAIGAWTLYQRKGEDEVKDNACWNCIKFSGNIQSFTKYFHTMMTKDLCLQMSDADYLERVEKLHSSWNSVMLRTAQVRLRKNSDSPAVVNA